MADGKTGAHAFQGIITKLQTTKGTPYALGVMKEAADRLDAVLALHKPGQRLYQAGPSHQEYREECGCCRVPWPCATRVAIDGPVTTLQRIEATS